MGLAQQAQSARKKRCSCTSVTTRNATIAVQPPFARPLLILGQVPSVRLAFYSVKEGHTIRMLQPDN